MDIKNEGVATFPSYANIIEKIRSHLLDRKGTIVKRTLLISLPGVIYVGLYCLFLRSEIKNNDLFLEVWKYFYVLLPFVLIYTLFLTHLFSIEKIVWIDSYFDNKNLDVKSSFKIAKNLFWASLRMRLKIFLKYYLIAVLLFLNSLSYIVYIFYKLSPMSSPGTAIPENFNPNWSLFMTTLIISVVILYLNWFYFYYLKIKLRYFWFIYLDNYGKQDVSFREIILEMNKFNKVQQSESFKKSLIINFGIDATKKILDLLTIGLLNLLSPGNKYGETAVVMIKLVTSEVFAQFASLSKITGNYMLYQYIRYFYYKNPQEVNENIYKLAN